MNNKISTEERIVKNPDLMKIIKSSKNLNVFLKIAEKRNLLSEFCIMIFFYQFEEIVLKNLERVGVKLGSDIFLSKSLNIQKKEVTKKINGLLHYNIVQEATSNKKIWKKAENWMLFFISLGEFIQKQKNVDFYINYIETNLVSTLICLGIIKSIFFDVSNEIALSDEIKLDENLNKLSLYPGDEVIYLDGENWRTAEVISFEKELEGLGNEFGPFLKINVKRAKNNNTIEFVPRTLWNSKFRISGNHKKTRGSVVNLDDEISNYIKKNYGDKMYQELKLLSTRYINLIGGGIEKEINMIMEQLEFKDETGQYGLSDFLYFDTGKINYRNINLIKSNKRELIEDDTLISIFVGSTSGLSLNEYKTKRNVFLINRKKTNTQNNELMLDQFLKSSIGSLNSKINKDFSLFLNEKKITIPKGCEIYAY